MPVPVPALPPVPRFVPSPATRENLPWAELPVIDFSRASTADGLRDLVAPIKNAMHTTGCMYVVNHGLTPAQNERMLDIADVPFSQVPEAEKKRYLANPREDGFWWGYKMRQFFHVENGVHDQVEHYSAHHAVDLQEHPEAMGPFLPEVGAFNEFNHRQILFPVLRALAQGLELYEEVFVDVHKFDGTSGKTWARFQKYFPYTEEEEKKTKDVWIKGHTDSTSISVFWSQPVGGLQVKSSDGEWLWVRHIPNAVIVNIGDAMEVLSGGFYKAVVHRVVQPPADQRGVPRLCLFYLVNTDDDCRLAPLVESPVLQRVGVVRKWADADAPTMAQWQKARLATYGSVALQKKEDGDEDEEVMQGVFATVYN